MTIKEILEAEARMMSQEVELIGSASVDTEQGMVHLVVYSHGYASTQPGMRSIRAAVYQEGRENKHGPIGHTSIILDDR